MINKHLKKHLLEYLKLLQIQTELALQDLRRIQICGSSSFRAQAPGAGRGRWEGLVGMQEGGLYMHYFILVASKSIEGC